MPRDFALSRSNVEVDLRHRDAERIADAGETALLRRGGGDFVGGRSEFRQRMAAAVFDLHLKAGRGSEARIGGGFRANATASGYLLASG